MALVFGFELPVLEFLLIMNIFTLIYIVISMFELRNLLKIKEEFTRHLELIEKTIGAKEADKQLLGEQRPISEDRYVYSKEEKK
jgi:hypothetical protein